MNDTAQLENTISDIASENYDVSMLMSLAPVSDVANAPDPDAPGELPVQGGGTVKINYSIQDFRPTCLDEYTREPLPQELVRAAIREELD